MNRAFWSGKQVLLTGHTGFKGSWMALWLSRLGAHVTGYSLPAPTQPSLFELARVAGLIRHIPGDVRDLGALQRVVDEVKPDIAIHMAAQSLVRVSFEQPVETYATNVMGTVHFLESLRKSTTTRVAVVVTSDKCYASNENGSSHLESDPMGGYDPYSSSKGCAELAGEAYRRSFFSSGEGFPILATVRAGNVLGGGDWSQDRLVPDVMRALIRGIAPEIRNPASIRPWQHVLEPVGGYLLLAERLWLEPALAGAWNFGSEAADAMPVNRIVEQLISKWGSPSVWQPQPGKHPQEAAVLRLDSSKARQKLGWKPRWNLNQALDSIVTWHRQWLAGADLQALALSQIEQYERS